MPLMYMWTQQLPSHAWDLESAQTVCPISWIEYEIRVEFYKMVEYASAI
jgi:hypothetical protein